MLARFPPGSHMPPARDTAEQLYAQRMEQLGEEAGDVHLLGIAAEAFMNLSPWDYIQVSCMCDGWNAPSLAGHRPGFVTIWVLQLCLDEP